MDLIARAHFDEPSERMWAAWIEELGGPERIRYGELPVPRPGPTDVLVRVEAVAVTPWTPSCAPAPSVLRSHSRS